MKRYVKILLLSLLLLISTNIFIKMSVSLKTLYRNDTVSVVSENNTIRKAEKAKREQERLRQERLEQERLEKERKEQERLEQERLEQERLEKEKQEKEKKEKEQSKKAKSSVIVTSTKKEATQANSTFSVKYGTYGRLYVSGFSVALYDYNVNTKSSDSLQTIVNNKDSAAYYRNHGRLVIADHHYQGFKVLANLNEGTTSYIKFENGTSIKYKLIKKSKGVNTAPDLVDTEGNSFFDMKSDLIMYTCYEDGIMATLWALA